MFSDTVVSLLSTISDNGWGAELSESLWAGAGEGAWRRGWRGVAPGSCGAPGRSVEFILGGRGHHYRFAVASL